MDNFQSPVPPPPPHPAPCEFTGFIYLSLPILLLQFPWSRIIHSSAGRQVRESDPLTSASFASRIFSPCFPLEAWTWILSTHPPASASWGVRHSERMKTGAAGPQRTSALSQHVWVYSQSMYETELFSNRGRGRAVLSNRAGQLVKCLEKKSQAEVRSVFDSLCKGKLKRTKN